MLLLLAIAGLTLLLVVGIHQLLTAPLSGPDAKRQQLMSEESTTFTRSDLKNPRRLLKDTHKLRNTLVVVAQISVVVMAVWMSIHVIAMSSVPVWFKLLVGAVLVVGSLLVGRGVYLRLGLYQPVTVRESLRTNIGREVAEEFDAIRQVADTTRSESESTLDEASIGLLAAAKHEQPVESVREWARTEEVADPAVIDDHTERLVEADVIRRNDGRLALSSQFVDADEDQLVSVAASILS